MATDVLQFVDSVSATAALRLDLNDGTVWGCDVASLDFSPPPLRRAINGTLLVDGSTVSASSYDNRILRGRFDVLGATVDATATQIQNLMRELDRDGNFLKWQPAGATSPVFFRTIRSPASRVTETPGPGTYKTVDVELLAEPFAVGLREDVAVGTVNNDPAAGANGLFFDISAVKGDAAAPVVLKDNRTGAANQSFGALASRQSGTPSDLVFFQQSESMTLGTDTTNPGGVADAVMSGAGTTNYVRCTFATASTIAMRTRWDLTTGTAAQRRALNGTYRVFACVRRSDAVSVIRLATMTTVGVAPLVAGSLVAVPLSTSRQLVDLGLVTFGAAGYLPGRFSSQPATSTNTAFLDVRAQRDSGAGTIDFDYLMLAPADAQFLTWLTVNTSTDHIVDGGNERLFVDDAAGSNIFDGSAGVYDPMASVVGGFPAVQPGQANRFYYLRGQNVSGVIQHDKTIATAVTVSYWPRYLYIRPATT